MGIRVLIADPLPVVRAGLFAFLRDSDFDSIDEAMTGEQTYQKAIQAQPDLVLLPIDFSDETSFQTIQKLRNAGFSGRIVIFTEETRDSLLARAIAVGADAWLLKKSSRSELIRSLHLILESGVNKFRGELGRIAPQMKFRSTVSPTDPLTAREFQVLRHVALGLSNKEIAASLGIGFDTVKEHVGNILRKLGVRDRTEAAIWAMQNNKLH